jgi:hypothetical protein
LIKKLYSKVVFFFVMLISLNVTNSYAQNLPNDTIKKQSVDTLEANDEEASLEEKILYSAEDSVVALPGLGKVMLYGKAKVDYVAMNLESEIIEIDYLKNLVTAYGKKDSTGKNSGTPVFKDGEQNMEAEKIMYNLKTKKGKIFNAYTKQGELLVFGEQIKKDSTSVIYLKNMKCLPCQEADARTAFRANKAKIIPNDKIVTGPMYLEIGGVPTPLGLPFGYFPNTKKQHNGILLPTIGNSATQGFNLRNGGFYWGINDKTDMVITGDAYTNGSWVLRTVNNYNVLYKAAGAVSLEYSSFNIGDKDIPASYSQQKGYKINWAHTQDNKNNPSIRFSANVNYVKNQAYSRYNAVNSGQYLQNAFQSNVVFSKSFKLSSLSINASHSQSASGRKEISISFPQLTYNVNRFFPFKRENAVKQNVFDKIGVSYLLEAKNTLTGYDSTIFKGDIENRMAYGIKHSLPISTNFNLFKYITVTPALNFNAVMYTKQTRQQFLTDIEPKGRIKTDTVTGFVGGYDANFSTALNTKVFFDFLFKKGKIKQIRNLLIPTLAYTYRPDLGKEQYGFWKKVQRDTLGNTNNYSIFQNSIFSGPLQGKQNALSINLSNSIDAKVRKTSDTGFVYNKITLIQNISISANYNFAADSFKTSDVAISGRTVLFKYLDVVASAATSPYAYDKIKKRKINEYAINYNNQLLRLSTANLSLGTSFGSDRLNAIKNVRKAPTMTNGAEKGAETNTNTAVALPWDISLNYNLGLAYGTNDKLQPTHALSCRSSITPTKYWKVGITTNFDFATQKLSYTSVNIYRDLKCWEAHIDWIPFGPRKSYFLTINLKTSLLSEFKIPKSSPPINNL